MLAFERGRAAGADGFEIDVRLAADGEVVVIHDATVDRTTDSRGSVSSLTAAQLAKVDAAYWFDPSGGFPLRGSGVGVPRLAEAIHAHPDAVVIVELKEDNPDAARSDDRGRPWRGRPRPGHASGPSRRRALRTSGALEPDLPTERGHERGRAWRSTGRGCTWPLGRPKYRGFQVPEAFGATRVVTPQFIRTAHAAGVPVQVWTVDEEQDMRRLLEWGVDGLITDRPECRRKGRPKRIGVASLADVYDGAGAHRACDSADAAAAASAARATRPARHPRQAREPQPDRRVQGPRRPEPHRVS